MEKQKMYLGFPDEARKRCHESSNAIAKNKGRLVRKIVMVGNKNNKIRFL